ncbi:MAG: tetratricopeptide repeat protein, partial [Candidatus Saganbacteria bacterium]|nr:tetratricopeptide repeat protein [Candidatus Saganbacteria bacterium]
METNLESIQSKLIRNPKDAPSLLKLGNHLLSRGDFKGAKEKFKLAVLFSPRLLSQVILSYEKLLESEPENIKARLSLADFFISIKDQESAITELEEVLDIKPECSEVYNVLGYIYLEKGALNSAIALLEQAKDVGIKDISLSEMLAGAYLEGGKIEKAISVYEELLRSDRESKKTLRVLGDLYSRVKNFNKACENYVFLFHADQESGAEVSKLLKELSLLDSGNVYIKEQLAEIYIKELKPDLATETLKEIEIIDKSKRDQLISKYKKMLEVFPGYPRIMIALAESLTERGSYSEAAEAYQSLEALGGSYVDEATLGYKKIITK